MKIIILAYGCNQLSKTLDTHRPWLLIQLHLYFVIISLCWIYHTLYEEEFWRERRVFFVFQAWITACLLRCQLHTAMYSRRRILHHSRPRKCRLRQLWRWCRRWLRRIRVPRCWIRNFIAPTAAAVSVVRVAWLIIRNSNVASNQDSVVLTVSTVPGISRMRVATCVSVIRVKMYAQSTYASCGRAILDSSCRPGRSILKSERSQESMKSICFAQHLWETECRHVKILPWLSIDLKLRRMVEIEDIILA